MELYISIKVRREKQINRILNGKKWEERKTFNAIHRLKLSVSLSSCAKSQQPKLVHNFEMNWIQSKAEYFSERKKCLKQHKMHVEIKKISNQKFKPFYFLLKRWTKTKAANRREWKRAENKWFKIKIDKKAKQKIFDKLDSKNQIKM